MRTSNMKIKKGGLDTIVAFVVVMLPLVYVLVYMIATLYHFAVQTQMAQYIKETLVMTSTYGTYTTPMKDELETNLKELVGGDVNITYYVREFKEEDGVVGTLTLTAFDDLELNRADLFGIYVSSAKPSLLGSVSNFNIFGKPGNNELKYSAYREEIIRNDDQSL